VLGLANTPHFTMLPWPATPSTALGLASIYVYVHIRIKKCLACVFPLSGSLVAASAVHLVSMYLQSPLIPPCLLQLPATSENSKLCDSDQTQHRSVTGLDRVYGPNIRKSRWLRACWIMSQPVTVCGDSISTSGTAIALSEGILTSVLCVVIEYLCTSSRSY
jgi:hypothetical protein